MKRKSNNLKLKRYIWHRFAFTVLRSTLGQLIRLYMGFRPEKSERLTSPTLILANHNTDLDPVLAGIGLKRHIYFVSSEHALRAGFASKLLKFIFDPIPINKAITDVSAIREILRRLTAGASVCLFAEGDRSFNGVTGPIALSTAKLVKMSGVDLITYRFEGSYFVTPRWAKSKRRGVIRGAVAGRYTAEEIKSTPDEVLHAAIVRDLSVDAYSLQSENPCHFTGRKLAENIETVLYLCPVCNAIGTIKSKGRHFFCDCELYGDFEDTGILTGVSLPFTSITEWDAWQYGQLSDIISSAGYDAICSDEGQELFIVNPAESKTFAAKGRMYIDREVFHCAGFNFPLVDISKIAVAGQQVLLFATHDGSTYEVRSDTVRSALKYREIFRILSGM